MRIHEIWFYFYRSPQDFILFIWGSMRFYFIFMGVHKISFYLYEDPWDLILFLWESTRFHFIYMRIHEIWFYFYGSPQDFILFIWGSMRFHFIYIKVHEIVSEIEKTPDSKKFENHMSKDVYCNYKTWLKKENFLRLLWCLFENTILYSSVWYVYLFHTSVYDIPYHHQM